MKPPFPARCRAEAEAVWRAGVAAVDSGRLVREALCCRGGQLLICGERFSLSEWNRIAVVGAGKAGAGMAAAVEETLGPHLAGDRLFGWVNVPADCVRPLERIRLHAARPAGVNEPTAAGVQGAERILEIVSQLTARDLCLVLLSGGGSALLPAPAAGIRLEDKQAVTRALMHAGATIHELNCVRKQLSRIKGGGLARACPAGRLVTLIISDVIGDPLDVIASGPTFPDSATPANALAILRKYAAAGAAIPPAVTEYLQRAAQSLPSPRPSDNPSPHRPHDPQDHFPHVSNYVIGNNATALSSAAQRAAELGYAVHSLGSANSGEARRVGVQLAELARGIRDGAGPIAAPACVLWGGESVVHVVPSDQPRKGGRNQEVVLAALNHLWEAGLQDVVILSGGTDGEDGPTDAAGAIADEKVRLRAQSLGLLPAVFLAVNNSYAFFERTGGLFKTGPTHTNVMDLAVVLVAGEEDA